MVVLLLLITAAALGRVCAHDFTSWDDTETIAQNPRFNPVTLSGIAHYWTHSAAGLYVPVTYTAWGLLAYAARTDIPDDRGILLNPWVYHTANLVIHMLTSLVVFAILRRLAFATASAGFGAILFAIHPVQVEPVAWASGTKDLLCGLFALSAVLQYLRFAQTDRRAQARHSAPAAGPSQRRRALHYALATVLFVLAMLSKPAGVVTVALVATLDLWVLKRPWRRSLTALAPWLVLAIPCLIWTKFAQPALQVPSTPLWARPLVASDALAFYVYKLLFPVWLGPDYGRTPAMIRESGWIWITWIVPVALAVLLWRNRRRRPMLFAAGLIFVIGVAPVLGFSKFLFQYYSTVADHYLYLSMLGVALAAAAVMASHGARAVRIAAAAALLVFGVRSFFQTGHWKDSASLWSHSIEVTPQSSLGYTNLGSALVEQGNMAEARRLFEKAVSLNNDDAIAHDNLAMSLIFDSVEERRRGRAAAAEELIDQAIAHVYEVIRLYEVHPRELQKRDIVSTRYKLGQVLMSRQRYSEAIEQFERVLALRPDHEQARAQLELARSRSVATQPSSAADGSPR